MSDKQLMKEINRERHRKPIAFWGLLIAIQSVIYGEFIYRVDGFLLNHAEPYLNGLPEDVIGILAIAAGVIKIIGVLSGNKIMKRWGIWSLSGVWSALFFVAITFSFGSGYPHPSWIFALGLMVGSWCISFKGDFY